MKMIKRGKKMLLLASFLFALNVTWSQTEIPLQDYFRTLKSVQVTIEGKPYTFLFDTGGGLTLISPEIARELDKEVYGNFVGFRMSGEKVASKLCDSLYIGIGGREFFHPYVGVFDIMSLLPADFQRVDGLISLKTFEHEKISLNLEKSQVIVETERSFSHRIRHMNEVPARFANGPCGRELNIFLGMEKDHHDWWFLFDTGNIGAAKLSDSTAKAWGISSLTNDGSPVKKITSFILAGDTISVPTIIDSIIYDGALNFNLIRQSEYAISFEDERVWKTGPSR